MKYCSKFRKASAGVRAVISAELAAMQSTVLLTKGGFASRGQEDPVGLVWVGLFFIYAEHFRPGCIQDCKVSPIVSAADLCRRRKTRKAGNSFSIKGSKIIK